MPALEVSSDSAGPAGRRPTDRRAGPCARCTWIADQRIYLALDDGRAACPFAGRPASGAAARLAALARRVRPPRGRAGRTRRPPAWDPEPAPTGNGPSGNGKALTSPKAQLAELSAPAPIASAEPTSAEVTEADARAGSRWPPRLRSPSRRDAEPSRRPSPRLWSTTCRSTTCRSTRRRSATAPRGPRRRPTPRPPPSRTRPAPVAGGIPPHLYHGDGRADPGHPDPRRRRGQDGVEQPGPRKVAERNLDPTAPATWRSSSRPRLRWSSSTTTPANRSRPPCSPSAPVMLAAASFSSRSTKRPPHRLLHRSVPHSRSSGDAALASVIAKELNIGFDKVVNVDQGLGSAGGAGVAAPHRQPCPDHVG